MFLSTIYTHQNCFKIRCRNDEFVCRNGNCVTAGVICDSVDDCVDDSNKSSDTY